MNLQNGVYAVDGVPLADLAGRFGTPLYVYSGARIETQIRRLKDAFAGVPLRIKYAAKALTNTAILKLIRRAGAEIDAVSLEEVEAALRAGFTPKEILFTPNCVNFIEYKKARELGVMINIDNIPILERFGHEFGGTVPCCLRLNPHIVAGGHEKIQTGHIDSKFGISIHQLRHVQRIVAANGIDVVGVHVHSGSDILDASVFLRGAEIILEAATVFSNLKFVDFGSGFKVAYREGDVTTNVEELAAQLVPAFKDFCQRMGRELELWFEPGKFIVSEAGYLLVGVNVVKATPATVFAGVDSGLNHLIRPMMYGSYHEIVNISNPEGVKRVYSVVGNICETDTLGADRKLSEVREGDILAFLNGGAYGYSMSSNYNSRPRPAEVLILDGEAKLIRRRETLDDILRTEVECDF